MCSDQVLYRGNGKIALLSGSVHNAKRGGRVRASSSRERGIPGLREFRVQFRQKGRGPLSGGSRTLAEVASVHTVGGLLGGRGPLEPEAFDGLREEAS